MVRNKWLSGAIPALLIHCSIGSVYCWSLLKNDISLELGLSQANVEWAFSFAIFFLGMSAAFGGRLVERNVRLSAVLSTVFFSLGMIGSGIALHFKSLYLLYASYGVFMGIGLGIGYLTPVKTLMMWFSNHKGLATGIAVTGFGLAKVIASPIIVKLLDSYGIETTFYILGFIYMVLMLIGSYLIYKPHVETTQPLNLRNSLKVIVDKKYIAIWIVFFINITCGLAIISQEKQILTEFGLISTVALYSSVAAAFNASGRFLYSSLSDLTKDRAIVYIVILMSCFWVCMYNATIDPCLGVVSVLTLIFVCNAGYGGGFSVMPSMLSDKFGLENVSIIHGFVLSAWAYAGLVGNNLGNYLIFNYNSVMLFTVIGLLYGVAALITMKFIKE